MSVSLTAEDLEFLDAHANGGRFSSRSAVVAWAIQSLRQGDLAASYVQAFDEWAACGDAELWEGALTDGIGGDDEAGDKA